ncbi:tyrosine-type recombinase/integrase [Labilithrix luteola]|nr:site-specific integrase [Labilithrix luteola]
MSGVRDDATATERAGQIAAVANILVAAQRAGRVREYAEKIGACTSSRAAALLVRSAEIIAERTASVTYGESITFEEFSGRWTSGQLHLDHPDHVPKKQSAGDINILKNRVNPIVGPIPVTMFSLEDADRVMRELPPAPEISPSYRRAVAQVVHRVLHLAVYPAKIIRASPLPKGWLPKIGKPKAKSFLYPKEEAQLLANRDVDVRYRMLLGFLNREGPRKTEAKLMEWSDFDLENGTVTLDENKTDCPRSWVLDPSVHRALIRWKQIAKGRGPFEGLDVQHLGTSLRDWLKASDVKRPQLFKQSDRRIHFRAHDTRSTFVTLALANDRSEAWIMRRTAHKSSTMIARYTVVAATAKELNLGWLAALDESIPELADEHFRLPTVVDMKRAGGERGRQARASKTPRSGENRVKKKPARGAPLRQRSAKKKAL